MKNFAAFKGLFGPKVKQKQVLCAGIFLAVFGLMCWSYWAVQSRFSQCMVYALTRTAQSAFLCGNHYFGVYGSAGYNVESAEYYFGKAVELDPKTPDAWHQYARIAFLRGDFPLALYRINRQFEERGDELMASYYIRGLIEGYAKDYPSAEQDFKKFIAWDPQNWAANNDLAWIYFAQGKFAAAATQTRQALSFTPDNPWLWVTHAMSVYNLGDKETARIELVRAQKLAARLSEAQWSHSYPGNDPKIAGKGLQAFKQAIADDIALVNK